MQKLLIIDPMESYAADLRQRFADCLEIIVCDQCAYASQWIAEIQPDYLVMDFSSSEFEGFTALKAAKAKGANPAVVAILQTSYYFTALCRQERNIASTIGRPVNRETLACRISLMMDIPTDELIPLPTRRSYLEDMLLSLNININSAGGRNLLDVIPMAADDPSVSYTKCLYPSAAKLSGHTAQNVERNIRTAIDNGLNNGNQKIWAQYFPVNDSGFVEKPCNSDFISLLATILNMQRGQYCDEP